MVKNRLGELQRDLKGENEDDSVRNMKKNEKQVRPQIVFNIILQCFLLISLLGHRAGTGLGPIPKARAQFWTPIT